MVALRYIGAFGVATALHGGLLCFAPVSLHSPRPLQPVTLTLKAPPVFVASNATPSKAIHPSAARTGRKQESAKVASPVVAPLVAEGTTAVATSAAPVTFAFAVPVAPLAVASTAAQSLVRFSQGSLDAYRSTLAHQVQEQRRYPTQARRMRIEGVSTVVFRVRADGQLACPPVVVGASHPMLDAEALRMVEAAAPFPALPEGATAVVEFRIPIQFHLQG